MSDSTVFNAGQSLRRREMMKAAVVGAAGVTAGAASSGTVAAEDDDGYLPDPGVRHVFVNPGVEALYNYLSPFGDEGYAKEDVDEMSAENAHTRIFQSAESITTEMYGSLTSLENYIRPDDPLRSAQAEMAYSVLRTTALQAVQDGGDRTEARTEAENKALDELAIPETNLVRQWNEFAVHVMQWAFAFIDDEDVEWSESDIESADHVENPLPEFDAVSVQTRDDGLSPGDIFGNFRDGSGEHHFRSSEVSGFGCHVNEHTLVNGETIPVYEIRFDEVQMGYYTPFNAGPSNSTGVLGLQPPGGGSSEVMNGEGVAITGFSPDELDNSSGVPDEYDWLPFYSLLESIEQIADEIQSDASDIIDDIMDAYTAGDIGEMDILSSYDIMRAYGDSGDMTRYTAELLAAGLDAPDQITNQVTIDHPSVGGERTGRLFLSWNWGELADWEYEYDSNDLVLEVAEESIDAEPELVAVFEDHEETISTGDLDGGTYQFGDDHGTLERVECYSEGELYSHIPVGEETDHWNSAIFLYEDGEDAHRSTLDSSEPFELVAVETEDGDELDALELEGWNNQTRDPARALDEAQRAEQQYITVDELEEVGGGGGGGGGDSNTLLIGGMVLALTAMILAALMGDS